MLMLLRRWHAGDRSVRLFLSCHLLSFNQGSPDFRGCVLNKRKWSKWSDKSHRGKRSVPVTERCGMGTRDSTEALMEATQSVVSVGGFVLGEISENLWFSHFPGSLCLSQLSTAFRGLADHQSSFPSCSHPR